MRTGLRCLGDRVTVKGWVWVKGGGGGEVFEYTAAAKGVSRGLRIVFLKRCEITASY